MTPTEIISLIAIFITFLGIVATFFTQMAILYMQFQNQRRLDNLQRQFELDRERRQYIIPEKLQKLTEMQNWLDQGIKLSWDINNCEDSPVAKQQLASRVDNWVTTGAAHYLLATHYDPRPQPAWEWGSEPLPDNLPLLIDTMITEITAYYDEGIYEKERDKPSISLGSIHTATLAAVDRLRDEIVSQMKRGNIK